MTKTKRQLRAEAVERLNDMVLDTGSAVKKLAIALGVKWNPDNSHASMSKLQNRIADLLTDDDTHESREGYEERMYDVPVSDCPYCGCDRVVIHEYNDMYERPHSYRVEHVDEKEAFNCDCFESYYGFDSIEKAVKHADMREGERNEHPKQMYVPGEDFEWLQEQLDGEPTNGIDGETNGIHADATLADDAVYKLRKYVEKYESADGDVGTRGKRLLQIADMVDRDYMRREHYYNRVSELGAERDAWKAKAESALHENAYVGLVRGKQWERTEISDYYCGKCGWKVTDHDSYCPECGGALHKASNKPDSKFDARKTAEMPETDTAKGDIRDFDVTNLEWYAKNDLRKLLDLGIDGNMSCDDCPNQCVETEEGTSPEECQRRLLEWLMAPHANDDSTPENDVSADDVDANDANATQDSREKLEADVRKNYSYTVTTLMYPPSANKNTDMLKALPVDTVIGWLDRQAAITERERERHWLEIVGASANCNLKLTNQIAEMQAKVTDLQIQLEAMSDVANDYRYERDELSAELKACQGQLKIERNNFEQATVARDYWREKLSLVLHRLKELGCEVGGINDVPITVELPSDDEGLA